ncbi:hypothetical protein NQZ68_010278 [Dissostichus eleginoides]|nr:hypothetical protein NQZ68_010278 [Dissostichus eleginoides]
MKACMSSGGVMPFERGHAWLDSGFKEAGPPGSCSGGRLDGSSFRRCVSWRRTPKYLHDDTTNILKFTQHGTQSYRRAVLCHI